MRHPIQGWFYCANVMVSIWWQLLRYFSPQPSPDIKCSPSQYKWIQNVQYESLHWRKVQRYSKISNIKIIICLCMSKVHQKNSFLHVFTQTLNIKLKINFLQISKFKIDKSVLFPMMGMLSVLYIAECLFCTGIKLIYTSRTGLRTLWNSQGWLRNILKCFK